MPVRERDKNGSSLSSTDPEFLHSLTASQTTQQKTSKTVFQTSVVPTDIPLDGIGLPELIFEDMISDQEIQELVRYASASDEKV